MRDDCLSEVCAVLATKNQTGSTEAAIRSKIRRAKEQLTAKLNRLTRDRHELADTVTDLDAWAQRLREELRAEYPQLPAQPAF